MEKFNKKFMKTIIINENNLNNLIESKDEITFYSFFVHIKNFLKELLQDPVNATPSNELKGYLKCDNKHVIEKLIDFDIIRRSNKIIETPKEVTADNKSKVRYSVKYSIPKKMFKEKIHKLYDTEITKTIDENIENEYLEKYFGNPLKQYLINTRNDEDYHDRDMLYFNDNVFRFVEFLKKEYPNDFTEDELAILEQQIESYDDTVVDLIMNSKYRSEFIKWLQWNSDYNTQPTSDVMDYTSDVNNEWLIHFSDNAYYIWKEGFQYATDDIQHLAYSGAGQTKNKENEGYCFAYTINEFDKYAFDRRRPKYGDEAVMFQASGVKATHYGDEEEQVMFYNKDAKNIVYLQYDDDSEWFVASNDGKPLYHNEELSNVVEWVVNNFDQYRKHLVNSKEHKNIRQNNKTSSYGGV